jgi:hypothetical protein
MESSKARASPGDQQGLPFGPARGGVHLLHAVPLMAAAAVVPWQASSWFAIGTGALSLLHALAAALCFARRPLLARHAVRAAAYGSLAFFCAVSWVAVASAWYLVELYADIGLSIAAGLFAICCAIALFTLPIAIWGLISTRARPLAHAAKAIAVVLVAFVASAWAVAWQARPRSIVSPAEVARIEGALGAVLAAHFRARPALPLPSQVAAWDRAAPASCRDPVSSSDYTLLVTSIDEQGAGTVGCVQASTPERLAARFAERLRAAPAGVARAELALITALHALGRQNRLIDALKVRPAMDGVCVGARCLSPWQLVALGVFTHFQPIPKVPDARFGSSLDEMASVLAGDPAAPVLRFEAVSFAASAAGLTRLERLRSPSQAPSPEQIASAIAAAERYITDHQGEDGFFFYALDPYSSEPAARDVGNIARQAGAALILCELGSPAAVKSAARALAALAALSRTGSGYRALSLNAERAQLGHSALPLTALLSCRRRVEVGPQFRAESDSLIGDLGRFLLRLQRADGSFYNDVALPNGAPSGETESLFGAGQAVLALVLLEEVARAEPGRDFPRASLLDEAIQRAMDHYAERHWPRALRSLFFLEENWHCLAARAALRAHRHDGYERFCLDYVAFKKRFILDADDVEDPALIGGYGFGPIFPLHVTPAAGFAEALSAAIAVKRARAEPTHADEAVLARVLRFVSSQQWNEPACFACATSGALGGFSESAAASSIRVDYVQHALAALGHGAPLLGLR